MILLTGLCLAVMVLVIVVACSYCSDGEVSGSTHERYFSRYCRNSNTGADG